MWVISHKRGFTKGLKIKGKRGAYQVQGLEKNGLGIRGGMSVAGKRSSWLCRIGGSERDMGASKKV